MTIPFSVFKCLLCDFTSVPDCPLFYFLLLLLLMLWLLSSLISSSSRFSTVLFSFISTPYMFFQCLCISPGPSHFSLFSSFLCHFLSFSSSSSVFCRSFNFFTSLIFLSSPVWDVAIGSFFASPTPFSAFSLFNATYFQPLCLYLCMECNPISCEVPARMPFHKELLMGSLCCTISNSCSFSLLMNLICVNLEYPPLTSTLCRGLMRLKPDQTSAQIQELRNRLLKYILSTSFGCHSFCFWIYTQSQICDLLRI